MTFHKTPGLALNLNHSPQNTPASAVTVIVNDRATEIPGDCCLATLLKSLALRGGPVAVERNGEIVPGELFETTRLQENDRLEIVSLTGGG